MAVDNFLSDFVAAHGVVGSNHRYKIFGLHAVCADDLLHRLFGNASGRPSPAGMDRSDNTRLLVGDQNRNAVGGLNAQSQIRPAR